MARPKRSLSSLLDGADLDTTTTDPPERSKTLTVAPPVVEEDPPAGEQVDAAPAAAPEEPEVPEPDVVADVPDQDDQPGSAVEMTAPRPSDPPAAARAALAAATEVQAKPAKTRAAASVRSIKAAPEPPPSLPLYLELTRKEARFRQDQLNDLTTLTRQLNRRRASTGERITDNTLIRVAVDMMLKVADSLDGATEAELLSAVSAKLKR